LYKARLRLPFRLGASHYHVDLSDTTGGGGRDVSRILRRVKGVAVDTIGGTT
jgi:hypothetical protein